MPETLTFVFTDIVDSTGAKIALGDGPYREISQRHDDLIRYIAGAHEIKQIGDSFMLRFDDPADATAKMIAVQRRLSANPLMVGEKPLAIRVGIHTGNPIPIDAGKDFHGTAVDQAARYEALAKGGQILISSEVHALIEHRTHDLPNISYHNWGPYYLKGVGWRQVYEVLWDAKLPTPPSGKAKYQKRRFLGPFIGREKELGEIERYLADPNRPLITLHGTGGMGKTRLADEIDHRASQLFSDGIFFVELEATGNSAESVEGQIRADCEIASGSLGEFFGNKSALLILNNFESVTSGRPMVSGLLKDCGGLRVLATSQVPLGVAGEQIWPVDSLIVPDAEAMFLEYARRHDPKFEIAAENRQHLNKLFDLTDRIPFCLELAAAKMRPGRSLKAIVEGIGKSLLSLDASEMQSGRHRNVTACLDWSFGLLSEPERTLFPKLSVFQGGFLATDVASVCELPDAEVSLDRLRDASLLRLSDDRFFLLPTASEYASHKLGTEKAALQKRHADHFLAALKEADRKMSGKGQQEGYAWLRAEFENCRAGMEWAIQSRVDETVVAFSHAFSNRLATLRRATEQVRFCEAGVAAALRIGDEQGIAGAQNNLGSAYWRLPSGDRGENLRQAITSYESSLRVRTEQDFPLGWASPQCNLGNAYADLTSGDRGENLRKAIACYESALRVYTEQDVPLQWAMTQNNLGIAYANLPSGDRGENLRKAITCFESALRVRTEQDLPLNWARTQNNLGAAYGNLPGADRGESLRRAITYYESALRVRTEQDFPIDWAMTQSNLGSAYADLPSGDSGESLRRAITYYESALRVRTERDFPLDWARTQSNLGVVYWKLPSGDRGENLRNGIACYENAIRAYRSVGVHAEADELEPRLAELRAELATLPNQS